MILPNPLSADVAPRPLPVGRQLAITWGIPAEFGGMTAALLHRSRAFAEVAGAEVEIVTFDPAPEFSTTRSRLIERGELIAGMRLRNPYEDFRTTERARVDVAHPPGSAIRPHDEMVEGADGSIRRWHRGSDVVRVEHRRLDGSVALLDERRPGRRRLLTSFDPSGEPTGQWSAASDLYFDWLDGVLGGEPAMAIVDSKAVARMMQRYRRRGVALVYLVHGSHLAGQDPRRLDESRRPVFDNLHRWDAVVVQTERQRADIIELLGDTGNLEVVPNPLTVPAGIRRLPADRLRGVVVSRLSALKRIDHALRVVAAVRGMGLPVTLDIVGEGRQRQRLEREAAELGLDGAVRFLGYRPDAARLFEGAAWTLLTSRSEGSSLVLLEAMAAGCLPITYDIRYGAEVVHTRRNGWRVDDADIGAAARALAEACVLDDSALATMRRAAQRTAQARDERSIVARWADVEHRARRRHEAARGHGTVLHRIRVRLLRGHVLVTATVAAAHPSRAAVEVRLRARDGAVARGRMRSFGRLRWARLSDAASRGLGDGAVRTRFAVTTPDAVVVVDAGTRHPDRRSLPRRVTDRARRIARRGVFATGRGGRHQPNEPGAPLNGPTTADVIQPP